MLGEIRRLAGGETQNGWLVTDPFAERLEQSARKGFKTVTVTQIDGPVFSGIAYGHRGEVLTLTGQKTPNNLESILGEFRTAHRSIFNRTQA